MYVNKKTEQSTRMRARLIDTARELFQSNGFDGVSAAEIAKAANVTRGAVYHHFDGKEGLFEAVAERAMQDVHQRISAAVDSDGTARTILLASIDAFFDVTRDREVQQLLFVDAPAVMGWARWRACDEKYGLGALMRLMTEGTKTGEFQSADPNVSARLLLSAMIEGVMLVAANPDDHELRAKISANLKKFVDAL